MHRTFNTKAASWILFALVISFLFTLAIPYYTYDGASTSLLSYLAMPGDYPALTATLEAQVEGYTINTLANVHVPVFLIAIVLAVLLVALRDNPISLAAGGGVGIWGLIVYATNPALALGGTARVVQMCLLLAIAILGIWSCAMRILVERQSFAQSRATRAQTEAIAS